MKRFVGSYVLALGGWVVGCAESSSPPVAPAAEAAPVATTPAPIAETPPPPPVGATPATPPVAAPPPVAATPAPAPPPVAGTPARPAPGAAGTAGRPVHPDGPSGPTGDPNPRLGGGTVAGGTSPCATVLCAAKKVCIVQPNGQPTCVEPGAPAEKPCIRTGCSGTVCSDTPARTTCEYRKEYACYSSAVCARDAAGKCAWQQTAELTACLAKK
jgi:hypothetical protein